MSRSARSATFASADDRKEVIVTADIQRNAKEYMVTDTRFWVVRPRISAAGITGLGTLVSGEYISADVGQSKIKSTNFVGLEVPPIVTSDLPGREFVLHAEDLGSLDVGSSVFYRHLTAGQVIGYTLDPGGTGVTIRVFVNAPFDSYVNSATRFWQASGVDMSLSSDGVRLHTESLTSILEGGVAFQTLPGAQVSPVAVDTSFSLYLDEDRAMRPTESEIRRFVMYFKGSLRGLSPGRPSNCMASTSERSRLWTSNMTGIGSPCAFPSSWNSTRKEFAARRRKRTARRARRGYRSVEPNPARHPGAAGAARRAEDGQSVDRAKVRGIGPLPGSAARSGGLERAAVDIPDAFERLGGYPGFGRKHRGSSIRYPFDQLSLKIMATMGALEQTLKNADYLLQNVNGNLAPQVQATLAEAQAAMKNAKEILAQDAPLSSDLGSTLLQVSRAAKSITALVDYLERHPESLLRGKPGDSP
jgi:paraquat-inducible protein B